MEVEVGLLMKLLSYSAPSWLLPRDAMVTLGCLGTYRVPFSLAMRLEGGLRLLKVTLAAILNPASSLRKNCSQRQKELGWARAQPGYLSLLWSNSDPFERS